MDKKLATKQIWSRLTESELAELDRVAEKWNMTRSTAIRHAVKWLIEQMEKESGNDDSVRHTTSD